MQAEQFPFAYQPISDPSIKPSGCYVVNKENFLEKDQSILVPLKHIEYDVEIINSLVNITLTQKYYNPTDKFLEIQYCFPISPNACIYKFIATFGKTRIEGVVRQKQEAKKTYVQEVKKGKQAAYGQIDSNSKDIMKLRIGNVDPKTEVQVEISYLQELALSYNTFYRLQIFGTISPRYLNHIPKEDILKSFQKQTLVSKGSFYWSFKIKLKTSRRVIFSKSESHELSLIDQNDHCVSYIMGKESLPNKDFIFTFTTQDFELPSYVLGKTDNSSTALLSFIPKYCTLDLSDAYSEMLKGGNYQSDMDGTRGEYVFLIDRSGSMDGERIQKAKQSLILFIRSLPEDTYFNVVSFGDTYRSIFQNSQKYNTKDVNQAIAQIQAMSADMGGTEVYDALKNLLTQKFIEGYPKQIFLLTDGSVSNTQGVIKMVGQNTKYSRVHTIGIGNGCSQDLITGCAKKGKGYHIFITDQQNPSAKIIQLLTDSLSPVISKIKLTFDKNLVQSVIPNPQSLPYILKNQLVNFYVNFKGPLKDKTRISLTYEDSQNKKPYSIEVEINPEHPDQSSVDKMGHFKKIQIMEESQKNNSNLEDMIYYVKVVDKKKEIIQESVKHQILSEFTAFICVGKELADGKYTEIQEKGQVGVYVQPVKPIEFLESEEYQNFGNNYSLAYSSAPAYQDECCQVLFDCQADVMEQERQEQQPKNTEEQIIFQKSQIKENKKSVSRQQPQMLLKFSQQQYSQSAIIDENVPVLHATQIASSSIQYTNYNASLSKKEEMEQKEMSYNNNNTSLIGLVINKQNIDGSWSDFSLISTLLKDDSLRDLIQKDKESLAILTFLVAKWIEKHHPEIEYSLLVKKALNWSKKNAANIKSYNTTYGVYVK